MVIEQDFGKWPGKLDIKFDNRIDHHNTLIISL